jgi:hypothetical protein
MISTQYLFVVLGFMVVVCVATPRTCTAEEDPPQVHERPHYDITKATSPVKIDAVLDEEAWRDALTMELPYEIAPGENAPAPVRTECWVTYDEDNFLIAFHAYDPDPSQIRARVTDRDTPWQDDFVGIMFDPFNDERRGFEIFINPLGVQMDLSRNDVGTGDPEDATWDAIWESAGRIVEDGYIVEIAIPFSSLRFPRIEGTQTWGFMAFRAYPRNVRHQISSVPFNRNLACFFCKLGKITGFEGITPGRNIELDPTLTTIRTDTLKSSPGESLVNGDIDAEPGLSMRWGITPNVSLNAALNPDFSQVEADVAQLDVNNRFTLYFPETRPFFLEGADFYHMPLQVVHTRTVVEPSYGLKFTGKEGKHAIGAYTTRDDINTLVFPSNQESDDTELDQGVTSGIFRYRRDVGQNSTLGTFMTVREGGDYHNRVYGMDGHLRITPRDIVRLHVVGSNTAYPNKVVEDYEQPSGSFNGGALLATYAHSTRNYSMWAEYEKLSPQLRVDAGFIPRVDIREAELGGRLWGESGMWYSMWNFGGEWERIEDHNGTLTDQNFTVWADYQGPMQTFLSNWFNRKKEFYEGITYDQNIGGFHFNFQPTGYLNFWFTGNFGDAIDYDNSRAAKQFNGGPGMRYYCGRHLQLLFDYTYEQISVEGERLFRASLNQFRMVYQFNVQTFVRAIFQHTDISRNVDLYLDDEEPKSRELFTQLLFSYKINPQTVLFLGYSDNRDDDDRKSVILKDRTFFFKLGYAWLI